jgi:hypothetical protein
MISVVNLTDQELLNELRAMEYKHCSTTQSFWSVKTDPVLGRMRWYPHDDEVLWWELAVQANRRGLITLR